MHTHPKTAYTYTQYKPDINTIVYKPIAHYQPTKQQVKE